MPIRETPPGEGRTEPWNQGRGPGKRLRGAQALSSGTMVLGDPLMSQKGHTAPEVMPRLPAGARNSPPRWAEPFLSTCCVQAQGRASHLMRPHHRPALSRGSGQAGLGEEARPPQPPGTSLDQVGPGKPPPRAAHPSGWPSTRTGATPSTPRPQLRWGRCRYLLLVMVTLLAAGRRGVVVEDGPGQVVDDGQLPLQGVLDD